MQNPILQVINDPLLFNLTLLVIFLGLLGAVVVTFKALMEYRSAIKFTFWEQQQTQLAHFDLKATNGDMASLYVLDASLRWGIAYEIARLYYERHKDDFQETTLEMRVKLAVAKGMRKLEPSKE